MREVSQKSLSQSELTSNRQKFKDARIEGIGTAIQLAKAGRIITAIKYLETSNPGLSREKAKATVNSFGYTREPRWPEEDLQPIRCL